MEKNNLSMEIARQLSELDYQGYIDSNKKKYSETDFNDFAIVEHSDLYNMLYNGLNESYEIAIKFDQFKYWVEFDKETILRQATLILYEKLRKLIKDVIKIPKSIKWLVPYYGEEIGKYEIEGLDDLEPQFLKSELIDEFGNLATPQDNLTLYVNLHQKIKGWIDETLKVYKDSLYDETLPDHQLSKGDWNEEIEQYEDDIKEIAIVYVANHVLLNIETYGKDDEV